MWWPWKRKEPPKPIPKEQRRREEVSPKWAGADQSEHELQRQWEEVARDHKAECAVPQQQNDVHATASSANMSSTDRPRPAASKDRERTAQQQSNLTSTSEAAEYVTDTCLGIRFDITKLEELQIDRTGVVVGGYAFAAYFVLWRNVDPELIVGAVLYSGDTQATLDRRENCYCIAIQGINVATKRRIKHDLGKAEDFKRVADQTPFVEAVSVTGGPLVADATVNQASQFIPPAGKREIFGQLLEGFHKATTHAQDMASFVVNPESTVLRVKSQLRQNIDAFYRANAAKDWTAVTAMGAEISKELEKGLNDKSYAHEISSDVVYLISKINTAYLTLKTAIGAPSSPHLSGALKIVKMLSLKSALPEVKKLKDTYFRVYFGEDHNLVNDVLSHLGLKEEIEQEVIQKKKSGIFSAAGYSYPSLAEALLELEKYFLPNISLTDEAVIKADSRFKNFAKMPFFHSFEGTFTEACEHLTDHLMRDHPHAKSYQITSLGSGITGIIGIYANHEKLGYPHFVWKTLEGKYILMLSDQK